MNKKDRAALETLQSQIDHFVSGSRSDSLEVCKERAEEVSAHVDGLLDGLRDDIKNRDADEKREKP